MPTPTRDRARWLLAAAFTVVAVPLLTFGWQTGQCVDGTVGSGQEGSCTSGPAVGVEGAWVLCLGAGVFVVYALSRALAGGKKGRHPRREG